jgi:hypothetical protein
VGVCSLPSHQHTHLYQDAVGAQQAQDLGAEHTWPQDVSVESVNCSN